MSDSTLRAMFRLVVVCVRGGFAVAHGPYSRTDGEQMVDHSFNHFPCRPGCLGFPVFLGGRDQPVYLRLEPLV